MPPRLPMVLSIIVEPTTSAEGNQQSAKAAPVFRSHFLASHSHDTFLNFPFSHGHRGGTVGAGGGSNVVTLVTDRRLLRLHEKHLRDVSGVTASRLQGQSTSKLPHYASLWLNGELEQKWAAELPGFRGLPCEILPTSTVSF